MLGYVYGKGGALNTNQDLGVKVATPVGNFFGQLLFGWLADNVGRKKMCECSSPSSHLQTPHAFFLRRCRVNNHYYCDLCPGTVGSSALCQRHRGTRCLALYRVYLVDLWSTIKADTSRLRWVSELVEIILWVLSSPQNLRRLEFVAGWWPPCLRTRAGEILVSCPCSFPESVSDQPLQLHALSRSLSPLAINMPSSGIPLSMAIWTALTPCGVCLLVLAVSPVLSRCISD